MGDNPGPATPLPDLKAAYDGLALVRHLEASADPAAELVRARGLLAPGGLLYLEIGPDGRWFIPMKAARRLIENAGFRIVRRVGSPLERPGFIRSRPVRLWCRRY